MTTNEYRVSFQGNENVLNLTGDGFKELALVTLEAHTH